MDIHFVKEKLTVPADHPAWEKDLLAALAAVPSHKSKAAGPAAARGRGTGSLLASPRRARD